MAPWLDFGIAYRADINYFDKFAYLEVSDPREEFQEPEEFFFERSPYRLNAGNFILSWRYDMNEFMAIQLYGGGSNQ